MARKGRKRKTDYTKLLYLIIIIIVIVAAGISQKDKIIPSSSNAGGNNNIGDSDLLKIGSFNIQVFGQSKSAKTDVMNVLADIIRTYDIIAVQEIRDSSGTALDNLLRQVNSDGSSYAYLVSERLGRTSSKEQYAYVYNTRTVSPIGKAFTYPQTSDIFHRTPYIASFKSNDGIFNATFAVIHTDPDDAANEIKALYEVAEYAKGILPADEPVIIMGDYNADGRYFDETSYVPLKSGDYLWIIGNEVDTTVASGDNTYDRIVSTRPNIFYTGDAGAFRFDETYNLSHEFAAEVSDHYPVYAYFSRYA
ncbi:MAG: endonuclease/exonuclease/phosphatase family protein [Methanomicrobium sp.]|nr:endonuclease/exonuclease/phosphatase family protein [Methanomicrobium sp.]